MCDGVIFAGKKLLDRRKAEQTYINCCCFVPVRIRAGLRIPMMSISHSNLMPIRSERSDAGLSHCETVIDIRQEFCLISWF
jgi:hypothetical protein